MKKKKIKFPKFPKGFFSFHGGEGISCDMIDEWIKEAIEGLDLEKEESWTCVGSGDTMVYAFKCEDEIEIVVTRGYFSKSIYLK
jgi:hypothetical protein